MKRQDLEKKFLSLYQNANQTIQETLFQDLLNNASTETLSALLKAYKSAGVLDNLEEQTEAQNEGVR